MGLNAVCEWAEESGYILIAILCLFDIAVIIGVFVIAFRLL